VLQPADKAPDFVLNDQNGQPVSLRQHQNKHKVVLYFYPRDNTPGCTREACSFRDAMAEFKKKGAVVLGVSPDSVTSHEKFAGKYELPFPLLSDPEREVSQLYGVFKEKLLYGKKVKGIERTTVVIDKDGGIRKIFRKVKVDGHVDEVLATLE
jgi:thioredoxin-dependent peroxiredoxin